MVDVPATMPAQLYLISYHREKQRFTSGDSLGIVLRGAALAELRLRGNLVDVGGRPTVARRVDRPADPVLAGLLDEIAGSRTRTWQSWAGRRAGATRKAVAADLTAGRWVEPRRRRLLGIIPLTRLVLLRPRAVTELHGRITAALRGSTPAARVAPWDATLAALAGAGELGAVLPGAVRRRHKKRLAELSELAGPVPKAVRRAVQAHVAATAVG